MEGILSQIDNMWNAGDIGDGSLLGDPTLESEVFLSALHESCDSDEEFASILESCGTQMALYDLIDNPQIAMEVVKKIQVNDWKSARFNRVKRRTAVRLAMINNDPLYAKYRKYRDLFLSVRSAIYKKYENKSNVETRKIIKNSRMKASNMGGTPGHDIVAKMDKVIAKTGK